MKRFLILTLLTIALLLGGFLGAAHLLIDTEQLRQQFESSVMGATGAEAKVTGEVSFTLLPMPVFVFNNVTVPNISGASTANFMTVRQVQAEVHWHHIFSRTPMFSGLKLIGAELELELLEDGRKNWQTFMSASDKVPVIGEGMIPPEVVVENSQLLYRAQDEETVFHNINLTVGMPSWRGPYSAEGQVAFRKQNVNVDANIASLDTAGDAILNLSSDAFEMSFKGKTAGDNTLNISGVLDTDIKNLGLFTGGVVAPYSVLSNITSTEELKVNGTFTLSDTVFSARGLTFNSQSIKAQADIRANFDSTALWDVTAHIELLDIDALTGDAEAGSTLVQGPGSFAFTIPAETSTLFYLTGEKIIYKKDNIIDLTVDAAMASQQIVIHTFEGTIPGKSNINFIGGITHNGIRPLLEGEIELNGNSFYDFFTWLYPQYKFIPRDELQRFVFKSSIDVMPTRIRAANIRGTISDIGVYGEFEMRPEERMPSYRYTLDFDKLNLDALNIPAEIVHQYQELKKTIKDPFADTPTRKLDGVYHWMLTSRDLQMNGNHVESFALDMTVSPERIDIRKFTLKSGENDVNLAYESNLSSEEPTLKLDLSSQALNLDIFFPPSEDEAKFAWSTEPINSLGLERFLGKIRARIGYLRFKDLRLQNVDFGGSLKEGVLSLDTAQANFGGGPLIVKGRVGVGDTFSYGLSYGMNGVQVGDLLSTFTHDVGMKGLLFVSGKVSSFGKAPMTLVNNMTGEMKFSGKDIVVNKLDISTLIQRSPQLRSALDLDELVKYAERAGSTRFDAVAGSMSFANGYAKTSDLKMSTQYSRGAMSANVDMRNFQMKGVAKYQFAVSRKKFIGLGLSLQGPLLSPARALDASEIEKYITDQAKRR